MTSSPFFECFYRTPVSAAGSTLDVLAGIGTQLGRVVERQRAATAARRSQEQLRRSEARLCEAQALAQVGSWHFDLASGEREWSRQLHVLFSLDPGGPTPDLGWAMSRVHPADRPRAEAWLSQLIETGERRSMDVRVLGDNGEVRWHRTVGVGVHDDAGAVIAIHGTSQDVAERKLAAEALRERELQLAEAHRVARLGWWEMDLRTGRVSFSPETYELWGWDAGMEVTPEAVLQIVHADDRERVAEELAQVTQSPECFDVDGGLDFRIIPDDGRPRWLRARRQLVRDEDGTPVKVAGTVQDVTEEKVAEEDLRSAKERYRRILETAHEGVLTLDAQNDTVFANRRLAQMLGYSVEEMPGMPAAALMDPETQAALFGPEQRRGAGSSEQFEGRFRAKDGTLVEVLVAASRLDDEHGRYAGALAMVADVSALRQAEDVLRLQSNGAGSDSRPPLGGLGEVLR